jgi:hypothetical protein
MQKTAQLNFNMGLYNEAGELINGETGARVLARGLLQSVGTDESEVLKYFSWSQQLMKDGVLTLDQADTRKLHKFVAENKNMYIIAKGPLLTEINKAKFE